MRPLAVVATVAETRQVERTTLESAGLSVEVLMERAAVAVASVVAAQAEPPVRIAVLAGTGHNGGDAAACARILRSWGHDSQLYCAPGTPGPVVSAQIAAARAYGVPISPLAEFKAAPVVVDGLFGFGLNRAPEGVLRDAIGRVNERRGGIVVAIDLPSGTHGDTGMAPGGRVEATQTVATGLVKLGAVSDPAVDAVGDLWQADLGFLPAAIDALSGHIIGPASRLERRRSAHKGDGGTALVIGGSTAMSGAPGLMARAAYRAGAGLVIAMVPRSIRDAVAIAVPEALVVPLDEDGGSLVSGAAEQIKPYLERATAIALGPGLGTQAGAQSLASWLWSVWDGPLLADADALVPAVVAAARRGATILTPHPGEAGRLLGRSAREVQSDRLAAGRELAARLGATVVLKGARTLVVCPDGAFGVLVNTTPALATAGSGDVLSGFIVGLLAQRQEAVRAAEQAVALHAAAGLRALHGGQAGGVVARDLLDYSIFHGEPLGGPTPPVGFLASRLT